MDTDTKNMAVNSQNKNYRERERNNNEVTKNHDQQLKNVHFLNFILVQYMCHHLIYFLW